MTEAFVPKLLWNFSWFSSAQVSRLAGVALCSADVFSHALDCLLGLWVK